MSIDPISAILSIGQAAIKRIWPDPTKQAEEQRKLVEIAQKGDLAYLQAEVQLMLGQIEINKVEAASKSVFVAGWRPFIGWVGGVSLAYAGLVYPLMTWGWAVAQAKGVIPAEMTPPPIIETGLLGTIVTGMLGIGTMRSFDKKQKTQTDNF